MSNLNTPNLEAFSNGQLCASVFREIQQRFAQEKGVHLVYSDVEGNLVYGLPDCSHFPCESSCRESRVQAINAALSSGYPQAVVCQCRYCLWAIPVMFNHAVLGGLIIAGDRSHSRLTEDPSDPLIEVLLSLVLKYNLTNGAYLKQKRSTNSGVSYARSQEIELSRKGHENDWNEIKPKFVSAVKTGKLDETIPLLKRAFPPLFLENSSLSVLKSTLLEVYTMIISYNLGDEVSEQLNTVYYQSVQSLMADSDVKKLRLYFFDNIQAFLDTIRDYCFQHEESDLSRVLNYMESHLDQHLNRENVAMAVGMSVSKLSHLLTQKVGRTFPNILSSYRADRAALLLVNTKKTIAEIAADCGFTDQSYFNKVFKQYFDESPLQYREKHTA